MNKFFSIVLFPFIWIFMYLYRIIWFDLIYTLLMIVFDWFFLPLKSLCLLVTLPINFIVDIPVGLVVTLICAVDTCRQMFANELDPAGAIKNCFTKKR